MDVRFLVDDLQLQLKEQPKQSEAVERLAAAKQEGETARSGPAPGGVSVTMDSITKPQSMASGTVTFSDGQVDVIHRPVPLLVAVVKIALQRVGRVLVGISIRAADGCEGDGEEDEGFHGLEGRWFNRPL
jgi:hypothetical protein